MAEAKSDASGSAGAAAAAASSGTWVSPGDRLGGEEEFAGGVGAGCYVRAGRVHASIVGICTVSGGAKPVVSVVAPHIAAPVVPVVGSIVTAKVRLVGGVMSRAPCLVCVLTADRKPLRCTLWRGCVTPTGDPHHTPSRACVHCLCWRDAVEGEVLGHRAAREHSCGGN